MRLISTRGWYLNCRPVVVGRNARSRAASVVAHASGGYDYDLVIVGCGVGGHGAALHAVECGMKVAVIEGHDVGGTCVNRGCVPSKALLAASGMCGAPLLLCHCFVTALLQYLHTSPFAACTKVRYNRYNAGNQQSCRVVIYAGCCSRRTVSLLLPSTIVHPIRVVMNMLH